MRINEKEIEAVEKLAPFERYNYLIKRIANLEVMFSLKKGDEWAIAEVEDNLLFSLWSAKEFALLNATDAWTGFTTVEINFEMFEGEIIPLIKERNYLLNCFPTNGRSGFIVDIDEFLRDLKEELENYE
jgi:hypothetical protein